MSFLEQEMRKIIENSQYQGKAVFLGEICFLNNGDYVRMKRTFFSSSAADAVTVSRGLYGKVTDFFCFTKGWRLSPDIRFRKHIPRIFCNTLGKTEKIKNLFTFIYSPEELNRSAEKHSKQKPVDVPSMD